MTGVDTYGVALARNREAGAPTSTNDSHTNARTRNTRYRNAFSAVTEVIRGARYNEKCL